MSEQETVTQCTYPQCQEAGGCIGVCSKENSLPYPMQEGKDFTISKPWIGLTNGEIDDLWKTEYFHVIYELPRAIEAKLREKNGR